MMLLISRLIRLRSAFDSEARCTFASSCKVFFVCSFCLLNISSNILKDEFNLSLWPLKSLSIFVNPFEYTLFPEASFSGVRLSKNLPNLSAPVLTSSPSLFILSKFLSFSSLASLSSIENESTIFSFSILYLSKSMSEGLKSMLFSLTFSYLPNKLSGDMLLILSRSILSFLNITLVLSWALWYSSNIALTYINVIFSLTTDANEFISFTILASDASLLSALTVYFIVAFCGSLFILSIAFENVAGITMYAPYFPDFNPFLASSNPVM